MPTYWTHFRSPDPQVTVLVTGEGTTGTVLAVGDDRLLLNRRPGDRLEDLGHAFLTPGFWDSHIHLLDYGRSFRRLVFLPTQGEREVLAQVRARAQSREPGRWILGGGWNRWSFSENPDRTWLDQVAPHHPVLLMSWDYHTAWLNTRALERLGLDVSSLSGDRDQHGRWMGILRESAAFQAQQDAMSQDDSQPLLDLRRGMEEASRLGITGVTSIEDKTGLSTLQSAGGPWPLRVQVFCRDVMAPALMDIGLQAGFGHDYLRIMGVKWFLDGALGSGTAWMKAPYADNPKNIGIAMHEEADLVLAADQILSHQLLLAVHAIGDRAVWQAAQVLADRVPIRADGRRSRIEHAQLIDEENLERIRASQLAVSMQPVHLLVDKSIAEHKWGDRSRYAFRLKDVVAASIPLLFGSDAPVANPDPRLGLWAAVHRGVPPEEPWHPEQALSPEDALKAYTIWPAMADGRPSGRISPGCWGDWTLWSCDPMTALIHNDRDGLRVVGTVVGGRRIW